MKNIIIFGAPGSGKGTYSDEIVARYGMGHISTGDVLRAEIKNGTELGKVAKGYIDNGQLIPDELMIDILASTYDAQTEGKGVIFDVCIISLFSHIFSFLFANVFLLYGLHAYPTIER